MREQDEARVVWKGHNGLPRIMTCCLPIASLVMHELYELLIVYLCNLIVEHCLFTMLIGYSGECLRAVGWEEKMSYEVGFVRMV